MRYAVPARQHHLDAGHKRLSLVISVLFCTGRRSPYPYSTDWIQEFGTPALAVSLYGSQFRDETVVSIAS